MKHEEIQVVQFRAEGEPGFGREGIGFAALWCLSVLVFLVLPGVGNAALPGLTINGSSFTYDAPDGQVTGVISVPSGAGPHPGMVISHGKGGSANGFSAPHIAKMSSWGFACIAPNYTHASAAVNPSNNEAYCPENSRRAQRCLDILADLGTVDMARVALYGNSMGALLSAGLAGEIPSQIHAVCIAAGGTSGTTDVDEPYPATQEVAGITAPMLMFHGSTDTTVPPITSADLSAILTTNSIPNKRLLYQGVGHNLQTATKKRADVHAIMKAWFTEHGVLSFSGNTAPTASVVASAPAAANATTQIPVTVGDAEVGAGAVTVEVFSTDDALLPNTGLVMSGSGASRILNVTPVVGQTGNVEVAVVVDDGQLSSVQFLQLIIENAPVSSLNHRPTISWIPDQRASPGQSVPAISLTVGDVETAAASLVLTVDSSNIALLPTGNISQGGGGTDRTLTLAPVSGQTGLSTVTVTVSDGVKTTATGFTLTVATDVGSPPTLQAIADASLVIDTVYGSMPLVVQDTETSEGSLTLSASSSNPTLLSVANVVFGGQNYGRTLTASPAPGQTGRAAITLSLNDGSNTTSTAFVLDFFSANTPPAIVALPTYRATSLGAPSTVISFEVSDGETAVESLHVSASSSNTVLIPTSAIVVGGTGVNRTITVNPTAATEGAATITLSVSDGDIIRRESILFVVTDPAGAAAQFSRPRGIFILDSASPPTYTTTFGKTIALRDANFRSYSFVDGFTLRAGWDDMESDSTPGSYDFFMIQNALNKLPTGQKLSLIIVPAEPTYIATTPGVETYQDGALTRARPWDSILRERRRAFLTALAAFEVDGIPLSEHPKLDLLDSYLPGGFTGIRDPNGIKLRNIPGYTRASFLSAVQDELRSMQDAFPSKFIQIGFWPVLDYENAAYGNVPAWEWLRQQLLAEFNGVNRAHIGFFMENLAAKRDGPNEDPFSATPTTLFASALFASKDQAWNGFQMLGSWSRPFNDGHVGNTLNGSPGDGMEWAFNTYRAEYHELYVSDADTLSMQPAMQRWHDFFATGVTTSEDSDEDHDGLPFWWEQEHGFKPTVADALTDRDGDGLQELTEFAFNENPSLSSTTALPTAENASNPEDGLRYFQLRYLRRLDAPWLTYTPEISSSLTGAWQSGPLHTFEIDHTPSGDGTTEWVTVRCFPAITGDPQALFGRVAIQLAP